MGRSNLLIIKDNFGDANDLPCLNMIVKVFI